MSFNEPNWTGQDIGGTRARVPIISPQNGQRLRGVILSRVQLGVWIHWNGQRNVPCVGEHHFCRNCNDDVERRWRGYLAVKPDMGRGIGVIEYTDRAAQRLEKRLTGKAAAIRNCAYLLYRSQAKKRGEVILEIGDSPVPYFHEGEEPDLRNLLRLAWWDFLYQQQRPQRLEKPPDEDMIPLPNV